MAQMDEHPGIRTNTTICLGKIAMYLTEQTRQKVLVAAFLRVCGRVFFVFLSPAGYFRPFCPCQACRHHGFVSVSTVFYRQRVCASHHPVCVAVEH
jgi:hypothetical protein